MNWTPLQLQILLHYYCSGNDFRNGDFSAPAVRDAIDWFRSHLDLVRATSPEEGIAAYEITARGRALVDHILKTPLPVQTWVIPPQKDAA